jgi:hypothetical protein
MAACGVRALLGAVISAWAVLSPAAVHTMALHGDHPLGNELDAVFGGFSPPSLNNRGQVAFAANLTGSSVTASNNSAIWIAGGGGSIEAVTREGSAAPGMPAGTLFADFSPTFITTMPLNDAGEIAVGRAVTLPDTSTSSGLWIGNQHSLALLAAQGAAAPLASGGATFRELSTSRVSVNNRGDVAFGARLMGEPYDSINLFSTNDGVWIVNRDGPVGALLAGMETPEIGEDALIVSFQTFGNPSINRFGETALLASHKTSPGASSFSNSIWVLANGGRELRAATGQPLPEMGASAVLSSLSAPGINRHSTVAANVNYSGAAGNPASGTAVVTFAGAELSVAANTGAEAPGTGGHTYQFTFYEPIVGSGGHIAFFGSESDGTVTHSGVWSGQPDDLRLVALQGSPAPGVNANFGGFSRNTPAINRFGQVAFPAQLIYEGGPASTSLWATDLEGNLTLIARAGGTIEVAPGDARIISSLNMVTNHGDDDGRPRSMNDLGQIAFHASFTDGSSGVFLSDAVAHLPGDYNKDGKVDSADYIVWRKSVGTSTLLADGDRSGVVDEEDYQLLGEFFGMSLALDTGGGTGANVPEPHLAAFAILGLVALRYRRTSGSL